MTGYSVWLSFSWDRAGTKFAKLQMQTLYRKAVRVGVLASFRLSAIIRPKATLHKKSSVKTMCQSEPHTSKEFCRCVYQTVLFLPETHFFTRWFQVVFCFFLLFYAVWRCFLLFSAVFQVYSIFRVLSAFWLFRYLVFAAVFCCYFMFPLLSAICCRRPLFSAVFSCFLLFSAIFSCFQLFSEVFLCCLL